MVIALLPFSFTTFKVIFEVIDSEPWAGALRTTNALRLGAK